MRFIRGDSLKEAIERFHADEALKSDPGRRSLELRKLLRRFTRRLQRDRVRPQPGRAAPRHQAGQRHRRQARRDAGRRLGPGQGHRPGRARAPSERTLVPSSASGSRRDAARQRAGDAGLHEPRAGRRRPRAPGPAVGRLQPGRDALLPADRPAAVRGRRRRRGAPRACSGASSRRRGSSTRRSTGRWRRSASRRWRRSRRTATPRRRALAEDVERWMADEPVTAWREPFARRAAAVGAAEPHGGGGGGRGAGWPAWSGWRPSRPCRPGQRRPDAAGRDTGRRRRPGGAGRDEEGEGGDRGGAGAVGGVAQAGRGGQHVPGARRSAARTRRGTAGR